MPPERSYWEQVSFFKDIDIAIIGSGIVGLSAAIRCKENAPNARVVVFERGVLPTGASTRNAGFACFGSISELLDDLETQSENEVFALVEKRWKGLLRLRQHLGDTALDYRAWGGYEIFRHSDQALAQKCSDHLLYFNKHIGTITGIAETYQLADKKTYDFGLDGVHSMLLNCAEGQVHTGKMMRQFLALARSKGVELLNGITITHLEDTDTQVCLHTSDGEVHARHVLVATNGFAHRLLPDLAVQPARNQVLITEPIADLRLKGCFHLDRGYYYFRNIDNRVLLGGGRHLAREAETTDAFGITSFIQKKLEDLLQKTILPKQSFTIAQRWSGILGVGTVKAPIVTPVSPNVVVAVRMGGMGVAIGSLVGEEGADLFF